MPDALPISGWVTALRTAVGTVGRAIEMPVPAISSASMSSIQLVASEPNPPDHETGAPMQYTLLIYKPDDDVADQAQRPLSAVATRTTAPASLMFAPG